MTPIKREIVGQKRPPKSLLHGTRPFWLAGGVVALLGIAVLWAAESAKGPRGLMGSDEGTQPQLEPDMESVAALKAQAQRVEAQRAAARAEQAKQAQARASGGDAEGSLTVLHGKGPKVSDVVSGTASDDWKNLQVESDVPLASVGGQEDAEARKLAIKKRELRRAHEEAVYRRELQADEERRFEKSFYIPDSPQAGRGRASESASSSGEDEEDEDYEGGGNIAALRELSSSMLKQSAKQTASGTEGLSELTGLATALGAGARGTAGSADEALMGKSNEDRREDFFAHGADQLPPGMLSSPVKNPLSKYVLEMGSSIPGILVTGVYSESPGMITGEVSRNVYDSILQKHLLIPSGSKLVGTYSSRVAFGQERAQISWVRLVFPNGRTLDLEGMSGTDPTGQAGFHDQVNRHIWAQVGAALLGASITIGYAATAPANPYGLASNAHRAGGEELLKLSAKAQERWSALPPTLSIRPGFRFLVMVDKTVYFPGVYRDTEQHGRWKSPQVARSPAHPPVTPAEVNAEPTVVLR
jgi:type IV secretory pathway VirB10-like protein